MSRFSRTGSGIREFLLKLQRIRVVRVDFQGTLNCLFSLGVARFRRERCRQADPGVGVCGSGSRRLAQVRFCCSEIAVVESQVPELPLSDRHTGIDLYRFLQRLPLRGGISNSIQRNRQFVIEQRTVGLHSDCIAIESNGFLGIAFGKFLICLRCLIRRQRTVGIGLLFLLVQLKLYQQEQKANADRTLAANKTAQADKELAEGDPKKAVGLYRDAVAVQPDSALLNYKLSVALDRVGDTAAEREALQKAVQIDPGMAIAQRQLGYLAFNDGDFGTAEAHFREAVRAAPAYTDAWISLAATRATKSRYPEAEQAVQRALEIDPHNANALELQKELANSATGPAKP